MAAISRLFARIAPGRAPIVVAIAVGLLAAPVAAPGLVAAQPGEPHFEAVVPEPVVEPGTTTAVTVQLVNQPADPDDAIQGARNVRATMRSNGTPITVESGTRAIGDVPPGGAREVSFRVTVPADVEAGEYDMAVEVRYDHGDGERSTANATATVRVEERARFEVVGVASNVSAGERGPISLELENVGSAAARAASVTLESTSAAVGFDGAASTTRFVGDWAPGETRTLEFDATVAPTAEPRQYGLQATVSYETRDGIDTSSPPLSVGITPDPEQSFDVRNVTSTLQVGHEGTLSGTVVNEGPGPVRDAVVVFAPENPNLQPLETEQAIGDLDAGERATFAFEAAVSDTSGPGPRQLPIRVEYRDRNGDDRVSDALDVRADVAPAQSFAVRNVDSTLRVGGQGALTGTVENAGPDEVRNAVVVLQAENPALEPLETEHAVGDLDPGEGAPYSFEAAVAGSASPGPRQFSVVVRYRDPNGDVRRSDPLDVPAGIGPEQAFEVRNVSSTLRVGEEGELRGEVANTGETTVRNAVVVFAPESRTIEPVETEVAVGDLAAGERASFAFDVDVSESAGAGDRQFSVSVRYRDDNGDVRRSDPLDLRVDVGEQRERFAVDPVNATVEVGSSDTVSVRVTNRGEEPISDVSAKLFASSPISATDDEAFVERLEPGESTEMVFGVSAASGANAKVYPLSVDFQYDTTDGETQLSETYRVPLDVREPVDGSSLPTIALVVVAILVVLALVTFLYRRL